MAFLDLSFIDEARAVEVEAVDAGRSTSEFTLAPRPANFEGDVGEGNEEALHGSRTCRGTLTSQDWRFSNVDSPTPLNSMTRVRRFR